MPPFAAKDGIFCIIAYRDVIPFNIPSSHQGSKIKAKDIIKRQKYRYLVKPTERTVWNRKHYTLYIYSRYFSCCPLPPATTWMIIRPIQSIHFGSHRTRCVWTPYSPVFPLPPANWKFTIHIRRHCWYLPLFLPMPANPVSVSMWMALGEINSPT